MDKLLTASNGCNETAAPRSLARAQLAFQWTLLVVVVVVLFYQLKSSAWQSQNRPHEGNTGATRAAASLCDSTLTTHPLGYTVWQAGEIHPDYMYSTTMGQ